MLEHLKEMEQEALASLADVASIDELELWRRKYLGKGSPVRQVLGQLGQMSAEERPEAGRLVNELRRRLETAFAERDEAVRQRNDRRRPQRLRLAPRTCAHRWDPNHRRATPSSVLAPEFSPRRVSR